MLKSIPRPVSINSPDEEIIYFKGDDWLETDCNWQARISVPLEFLMPKETPLVYEDI